MKKLIGFKFLDDEEGRESFYKMVFDTYCLVNEINSKIEFIDKLICKLHERLNDIEKR